MFEVDIEEVTSSALQVRLPIGTTKFHFSLIQLTLFLQMTSNTRQSSDPCGVHPVESVDPVKVVMGNVCCMGHM